MTEKTLFELTCDTCEAEYKVVVLDEEKPEYCPMCGSVVSLDDVIDEDVDVEDDDDSFDDNDGWGLIIDDE